MVFLGYPIDIVLAIPKLKARPEQSPRLALLHGELGASDHDPVPLVPQHLPRGSESFCVAEGASNVISRDEIRETREIQLGCEKRFGLQAHFKKPPHGRKCTSRTSWNSQRSPL